MCEVQIRQLQERIAALQQSNETLEEENQRVLDEGMQAVTAKIESLRNMLAIRYEMQGNSQFSFGIWSFNFTGAGFLG
jgi:hypothetical protein